MNLMQALDLFGARTRSRTGTPLRAGDFKSHVGYCYSALPYEIMFFE